MATEDRKPPFDPTDSNPDPITQEPGAHPIGTGLGAAYTGAITTAVGGAFGGPVGAVVGAAVGAVAGGLLGKTAAESVNPTVEDAYWRDHYTTRPYVESGRRYEEYQPAYQTGYEGYHRFVGSGRRYEEVEPELRNDYETRRGGAGLAWERAKHATRDAWNRVEHSVSRHDRDHHPHVEPDRDVRGERIPEERLHIQRELNVRREPIVGREVAPGGTEADERLRREQLAAERERQLRAERNLDDPLDRI
ncbi:hypothetical protein K9N68_01260 [Kovacikia minuta CCNUW1]|uniref:hypothetical protein n=1 Tax=Kovacikia minuta TaxID=2931930 RepID=UPI001CCA16C8|nr:hypothetical protein [Kovacikia minuta]UBF26669.1 hypothetical protein K9N68_01260 [Kovacikia minuta CCNUW1]